jgi:SAF domain-containing protein
MGGRGWQITVSLVLILAVAAWTLAFIEGGRERPFLIVVAAHEVPANQKLTPADVTYAVQRAPPRADAVPRSEAAIGACSKTKLVEKQPLHWQDLALVRPTDGSCSAASFSLYILDGALAIWQATRAPSANMPQGAIHDQVQPAPSSAVARQLFDHLVSEGVLSNPPADAAIVEFGNIFLQELAKRLADNAADRLFARDSRDAPEPKTPVIAKPDH